MRFQEYMTYQRKTSACIHLRHVVQPIKSATCRHRKRTGSWRTFQPRQGVEVTASSDNLSYFLLVLSVVTILQHFLFASGKESMNACIGVFP